MSVYSVNNINENFDHLCKLNQERTNFMVLLRMKIFFEHNTNTSYIIKLVTLNSNFIPVVTSTKIYVHINSILNSPKGTHHRLEVQKWINNGLSPCSINVK